MADVPEVAVPAVDGLFGGGDGHVVLGRVLQCIFAAANLPLAPGRDDAQARVERHDRQFEAHLVIAFAGRAMRHRVGALRFGDLHHALGDQRPGEGSAQQIFALIDGARAQGGEDEIVEEFEAQVFDIALAGAGSDGFGLQAAQFFRLTQVSREADDFAAVIFAQPGNDDRRVKAAAVGQHALFDLVTNRHDWMNSFACLYGTKKPRRGHYPSWLGRLQVNVTALVNAAEACDQTGHNRQPCAWAS